MKKQEEKKQKVNPSEQCLHYLSLRWDGRKMKQNLEQDKAYLLDKMSKMTGDFSIYGKARAAVVFAETASRMLLTARRQANIWIKRERICRLPRGDGPLRRYPQGTLQLEKL